MKKLNELSEMLINYYNLSIRTVREKEDLISNHYLRRFYRCYIDGSYNGCSHYQNNLSYIKRFYNNDWVLKMKSYNEFIDFIHTEFGIEKNIIIDYISQYLVNFKGNNEYSGINVFDNFLNDITEDYKQLLDIEYMDDQSTKKIIEDLKEYDYISISHGTLKITDLIESALSFMDDYDIWKYEQYLEEFNSILESCSYDEEYLDYDFTDNDHELLGYLYESIVETIESVLPEYFYFGCSEGDGSDIAIWRVNPESGTWTYNRYGHILLEWDNGKELYIQDEESVNSFLNDCGLNSSEVNIGDNDDIPDSIDWNYYNISESKWD